MIAKLIYHIFTAKNSIIFKSAKKDYKQFIINHIAICLNLFFCHY